MPKENYTRRECDALLRCAVRVLFVEENKKMTGWVGVEGTRVVDGPLCAKIKKWIENRPNFERLVLFCMDSYDSESRRIFQHFSRSSKRFALLCTAPSSGMLQIYSIWQKKMLKFKLFFKGLSGAIEC